MSSSPIQKSVAIIGGGPAGLMAAEHLLEAGVAVTLFEAMPTVGRKFLMAGKSGLNITHSEDLERFVNRYGQTSEWMAPYIHAFTPFNIRRWAEGLGVETFTGSSGRIFPVAMKASPLLRAWLQRLTEKGLQIHTRHTWVGWTKAGTLSFETPKGEKTIAADATLLALGGGSWPRLGSNGAWQGILTEKGVDINPFKPSNCGFDVEWSDHFKTRFAGLPVKSVRLTIGETTTKGDFVVSEQGVEGSAIYMVSAPLRDAIEEKGYAVVAIDLSPDRSLDKLKNSLARPRGKKSLSNHLRAVAGIKGVKAGLLHECLDKKAFDDPMALAKAIKACPITLVATRPLAEAISSAGGVALSAIDENLMLRAVPTVFVAGEMLDWEAPTGGYLLTACFAQGIAAAEGILRSIK